MDLPTGEFKVSIDALGYRPERHRAFTAGLLAEAEDEMLQSIVTYLIIVSAPLLTMAPASRKNGPGQDDLRCQDEDNVEMLAETLNFPAATCL